jgi:hypothetical protein
MKPVSIVGFAVGVLVAASAVAVEAAEKVGQAVPKASSPVPAAAEKPAALESTGPVALASVEGIVVLKQANPKRADVSYMRIEDREGRVWLMEVNASTSVDGGTGKVDSRSLIEGVRVQATFPRVRDGTPVASSVTVLVP